MPKLTVEGFATVDVEEGKRLVNAIEKDAGVDILHACGGNARCTTCRIEFVSGEPSRMTHAEKTRLDEKGLTGVRLSCQIVCDHDMTVRAISRSGRQRAAGSGQDARTHDPAAARMDLAVGSMAVGESCLLPTAYRLLLVSRSRSCGAG